MSNWIILKGKSIKAIYLLISEMLLLSALALGLVDLSGNNNLTDLKLQESFLGSLEFDSETITNTDTGLASDREVLENPFNNSSTMPLTNFGEAVHMNSLTAASSGGSSGVTSSNSLGSGSGGGGSSIGSASSGGTLIWDNNGTFRALSPGDWCLMWQEPHHLYFQLGNAFFFMAFLAPHRPCGMLWLRAFLVIGSILMGMYGYLVECTPDVALWSGLFLAINFIYLLIVLFRLRPVRFDKEIEAAYVAMFKPLKVSRHQFRKVLNCMKVIRSLKYQEVYAQEKVTKVDSLSLVLSGKLVVSQNQRALHIVFAHQFLDSPEWFGVSTDDYFQVSIMAMEESRVLIWHRDKLKLSIMTEPFLQTVFEHILGRDVVKKLMQVTQVSESIASNGFIPSGIGSAYDDADDKQPMLTMKKSVDVGHGLTALINRQLQEEHVPLLGRSYKNDSLSVNSPIPIDSPSPILSNNRMFYDEQKVPDKTKIQNQKQLQKQKEKDKLQAISNEESSYREAYANNVPLKSLKEKKNKRNNTRKYENLTSPC